MEVLGHTLAGIELFRDVADHDIAALNGLCTWGRYEADQIVVGHEDPTTDVYFVVAGRVRVIVHSRAGKEVAFRDLGAGKSFGELSAIDGEPRSANVFALSPCILASMNAGAFRTALADHPGVAEKVMLNLVGLVRSLSDRVVEFSVLAVKNRIHAELLRLAREHGDRDGEAVIAPAPTHADIASRVSTHREAVTRELNALARQGLLERRGSALAICDMARLTQLVATGLDE